MRTALARRAARSALARRQWARRGAGAPVKLTAERDERSDDEGIQALSEGVESVGGERSEVGELTARAGATAAARAAARNCRRAACWGGMVATSEHVLWHGHARSAGGVDGVMAVRSGPEAYGGKLGVAVAMAGHPEAPQRLSPPRPPIHAKRCFLLAAGGMARLSERARSTQ